MIEQGEGEQRKIGGLRGVRMGNRHTGGRETEIEIKLDREEESAREKLII